MTYSFIEMFSLVEWLLFGFIGMNMGLAATCALQRGVKRLDGDDH